MKFTIKLFALITPLFLLACATIVGQPTHLMTINTTPGDAEIRITDEKGIHVFTGKTPTSVTLNKSDGTYFGGKTYEVTINKSGYQSMHVTLASKPSGWYIVGNFFFGGLIGWLVVDPLNGDMYNLSPENIHTALEKNTSDTDYSLLQGHHSSELAIVLLEDLPQSARQHLKRLH